MAAHTPVVYTLEISYISGEYNEDTDKVEEKEEKITTTAKYGQTLTTVFSGMQGGHESSDDGHYSLNYGYLLSGFHETNDPSVTHSTMPAPAEGSDTVALTAEWEGDTFEIYFSNGARLDIVETLKSSGINAYRNDLRQEICISLTYGDESELPEIEGLVSIGPCEVGGNLASLAMYNASSQQELTWKSSGDGMSADNPIVIYDAYALQEVNEEGKYYKLGSDLDYSAWSYTSLSGTIHLDGAGHTISNIRLYNENAGLFTSLSDGSTISDLWLEGISTIDILSSVSAIGILAGQVSGDVTITNVTVTNSSIGITGTMDGTSYYVGGLVGQVAEDATLTLTDCTVSEITDVSGAHAGNFYAGGFVGYATGTVATDGTSSWDNSTGWPEIGGPAGGDGETVEGGENTGTATDDPNSTEGGEPTAPAVPVTDAPPASEEDGPGAIQAQSKAALTQVPVVKYGQRRRLARRG